MTDIDDRPHRVVIIGSGFGGLFAAHRLRKMNVEVTMIAQTTHHLFQPLLYQVATGILSQGEIAPATREVLKKAKNTTVLLGEVTHIDVEAKTVKHNVGVLETVTPYDTVIVAAGAGQSYFGHEEYAEFAPGLKSVDDALELRGRIFGALEIAELQEHPEDAEPWMTYVVVGAGATGVEMAGQIRELSRRSLVNDYRNINPKDTRVILIDAGPQVLSAFGGELSLKAKKQLEKMNIEVMLNQMVVGLDEDGVTVKDKEGNEQHIRAKCKVWAAGVAASPLAKHLADQTGTKVDRSGRIECLPDLTLPGHPEIFVVGDMVALDDLPGVAQVAMQGGKYAADQIRRRTQGDKDGPAFKYFDKGSMATISRWKAVAKVGKLEISGFIAFLMWLFIHVLYLVGFQKQISTLGHWFVAFIGRQRAERTITTYQALGALHLISEYDRDQRLRRIIEKDDL